jgi:hypothetical protein
LSCFDWQTRPPAPTQQAVPGQQVPLQVTVAQPPVHFPAVHDWPDGQALPHAPQFATSVWTSTHAPPHEA